MQEHTYSKRCQCPAQRFGDFLFWHSLLLMVHTCSVLWRITLLCENSVTWLGSLLHLSFSPSSEVSHWWWDARALFTHLKSGQPLWYNSHPRAPCGINQLSPEFIACSTSPLSLPCFSHAFKVSSDIVPNKTLH